MRNIYDIIDDMRKIVKPCISKLLFDANHEGKGTLDKAEFETEFEAVLTLAEMALTMPKIPQNATNGDVIKAMFPNGKETVDDEDNEVFYDVNRQLFEHDKSWWNAPYKRGNEE